MRESDLQEQVANYLRMQYPDVLFHSDFGSGVKLTPGQAAKQKRQNGGRRAWPDLFIAKKKSRLPMICGKRVKAIYNTVNGEVVNATPCDYCGLFIELKKEGTRLMKKNGEWATPHIAEQAEVLKELRQLGYKAVFAVGFDDAKRIIDGYLGD